MHELRYFLEKRGFEVCSRLAERLGMKAKHVRIFFIYLEMHLPVMRGAIRAHGWK